MTTKTCPVCSYPFGGKGFWIRTTHNNQKINVCYSIACRLLGTVVLKEDELEPMTTKPFGYFDDPAQTEPTYDPGLEIDCPVCHKPLATPYKTISLMVPGDDRSYFYRTHRACYANLTLEQETELDSLIIDAVVRAKQDVN